jgi:hypothetical protein
VSRSKSERIIKQNAAKQQCGVGEHKKGNVGAREGRKREDTLALAKVYSCGSRARGS